MSKPKLDVWTSLSPSQQAGYRELGRSKSKNHYSSNRVSGHRRVGSTQNSKTFLSQGTHYICDEPDTATELGPIIGTMGLVDYSRFIPLDKPEFLIFIGDLAAANDQALLIRNNIKAILSLGRDNQPARFPSVSQGYKHLAIRDSPDEEFYRYFDEIYRFLSAALPTGNVLVHCFRGRNRSCAAVIYFLMKHFKLTFEVSREIVGTSRRGYMKLARRFENQLVQADRMLSKYR